MPPLWPDVVLFTFGPVVGPESQLLAGSSAAGKLDGSLVGGERGQQPLLELKCNFRSIRLFLCIVPVAWGSCPSRKWPSCMHACVVRAGERQLFVFGSSLLFVSSARLSRGETRAAPASVCPSPARPRTSPRPNSVRGPHLQPFLTRRGTGRAQLQKRRRQRSDNNLIRSLGRTHIICYSTRWRFDSLYSSGKTSRPRPGRQVLVLGCSRRPYVGRPFPAD